MELVRSAGHPAELWALLKFKYGGGREVVMPKIDQVSLPSDTIVQVESICSFPWYGWGVATSCSEFDDYVK